MAGFHFNPSISIQSRANDEYLLTSLHHTVANTQQPIRDFHMEGTPASFLCLKSSFYPLPPKEFFLLI